MGNHPLILKFKLKYRFITSFDINFYIFKNKIYMSQHFYYENRIKLLKSEYKGQKIKSQLYSWIRLLLFVCFAGSLILFFTVMHHWVLVVSSILFLISFIVLVKKYNLLEEDILFIFSKIQINKDEIQFINHDYYHRKLGDEYEIINPYLSNDFNLFGKGSLFQYLNRCNTNIGEKMLAQKLCEQDKNTMLIERKQSAINELSKNNDYIQDFQSHGRFTIDNKNDLSAFQFWLKESGESFKKIRIFAFILGIINVGWLILSSFGVLSWLSFLMPILLSQLVISIYKNKITKYQSGIKYIAGIFSRYLNLFKMIENQDFESEHLQKLQKQLRSKESKASASLDSLFKIVEAFETKNNVLISLLLNSIFLFDIHVCYLLLEWRKKHKDEVEGWFSIIGEMEVLISFASYAFNNVETVTFPTLLTDEFKIKAVETGHPLLSQSVRVNNDFYIKGVPSVQIITGANMAGKSTFLRTIVVNLILAMNGAPVIAKEFSFTPCDILSSIKVQDSLVNNESYFYAELLRLKDIIEHVKNNQKTLVILDEILRGTNTKDKQTGSLGILEKLISLNAMVVIATHDLSIGEMEKSHSGIVNNSCFEVELLDDQLIFDYKLKPGISRKLNASFLMHKMEIID
ncbi:MAG: hypothetical protein GZ091_10600 [Paludibacter sp.]|nr:hypothetical protein [Paludibacter sp.]